MRLFGIVLLYYMSTVSSSRVFASLSPSIIEDFKQSWNLLDHNGDSIVTILEAAIGILSVNQKAIFDVSSTNADEITGNLLSNHENVVLSKKCMSAVPDGPVFIDCLIETARLRLKGQFIQSNEILRLEDEVEGYMTNAKCDDISPVASLYCDDIAGIYRKSYLQQVDGIPIDTSDPSSVCSYLGQHGYCRLTCRLCHNSIQDVYYVHHIQVGGDNDDDDSDDVSVPLLISSDWHIEPWYEPSITDTVARYSQPTIDNLWHCFQEDDPSSSPTIPCNLNGVSDPPIDLIDSHFKGFQLLMEELMMHSRKINTPSSYPGVFFYSGDTQVHSYEGDAIGTCDEATAINDLMTTALSVILSYYDHDDVFLCPGNNDGPHNAIFSSSEGIIYDDSMAWAGAIIGSNIVNNDLGYNYTIANTLSIAIDGVGMIKECDVVTVTQVEFFNRTGYMIKQVDPSNRYGLASYNLFVISYNTNLGSTNQAQQSALIQDLDRIKELDGGVYILGHHPDVTKDILPDGYKSIVKGKFSGHVHVAASTTDKLYTQVPAISQAATDTGFYVSSISKSEDFEVSVSKKQDLVKYNNDKGTGMLADPSLWQYD